MFKYVYFYIQWLEEKESEAAQDLEVSQQIEAKNKDS